MKSVPDRLTFCFDLDGTICDTDESLPIPDRYYQCKPKQRMVDVITRYHNRGHRVIIETARTSSFTGLMKYINRWKIKRLTARQLEQWKVPYDMLRVGVKIPADLYIDDKALPVTIFEKRH
jgi:uncharacterized HAD superfamily protein